MDEDDVQQFSLRWHNHQNSVIGALGRMLTTGALSDVTLSATGVNLKAHRIVLAACSQYFAKLFKDVETENSTLVVVLNCEAEELRLLLTFMYTGEVTAGRSALPALLQLARTLQVSGLTDADTNPPIPQPIPEQPSEPTSPINLEKSNSSIDLIRNDSNFDPEKKIGDYQKEPEYLRDILDKNDNDKDKLSKLDQIVQNLYSTHRVGSYAASVPPNINSLMDQDSRRSSTCGICNKRLSNQYNLRVHMETHAGRRHACCSCSHVSRSRDALRKHVAYRHGRGAV
ncbi:protein abrupt-like isoform X1 [Danaus plexippus]|uniref:protein abrupt-like isoform X1 n=2 Tax=Danaus plexippus TaxID=13037 RepID=UPI002AB05F7D|nr:protein abrupt-like isoform X1 [Danaus plexippus]